MTTIFNQSITAAQALTVSGVTVYQFGRNTIFGRPRSLLLQGSFAFGGSGSTVDCYVQSSWDGATQWWDIAQFHFAAVNLRRAFNLSALTPVTTQAAPTDGTLAANTAVDGLIGNYLRVKWSSTGTYTAPTTAIIDAVADIKITPQSQSQ